MKDLNNIKIAITHGDINGIGYEIILKALSEPHLYEICTPIVYGSPKVAAYHKKALNLMNLTITTIRNVDEAGYRKASVINCNDDNIRVELGKATPHSGFAAFQALERASQDLLQNKIDIVVTAPINKSNVQSNDFKFPGHTEYFAKKFNADDVLMLMIGDKLKIGVVTGHVPLSKVASQITTELILKKIRILNKTLKEDFAIGKPVIGVLGLNPHAGDDGVIGDEEQKFIIPAIQRAREENIMAMGPYPADGFFGSNNFAKFDAILAMYHDQGLIPFKVLCFEEGVNFTAGLPIIRTSPGHGTAYEIAGKNEASVSSFLQAIYWAIDIYKNRTLYKDLKENAMSTDIAKSVLADAPEEIIDLKEIEHPDEVEFI